MDEGQLPGGRYSSGRMAGNSGQAGRGNENEGSSLSGANSLPSRGLDGTHECPLNDSPFQAETIPPASYMAAIPRPRPSTILMTDSHLIHPASLS